MVVKVQYKAPGVRFGGRPARAGPTALLPANGTIGDKMIRVHPFEFGAHGVEERAKDLRRVGRASLMGITAGAGEARIADRRLWLSGRLPHGDGRAPAVPRAKLV